MSASMLPNVSTISGISQLIEHILTFDGSKTMLVDGPSSAGAREESSNVFLALRSQYPIRIFTSQGCCEALLAKTSTAPVGKFCQKHSIHPDGCLKRQSTVRGEFIFIVLAMSRLQLATSR